jgi:hypothetical protein
MSECDYFHAAIERRLAGEVTAEETAALREHCRTCRDCRLLCAADEELRGAARAAEPEAGALAEVRRAVLRQARHEAARPAGARWHWAGPRLAAAVAAAAALVLLGFLAGRHGGAAPLSMAAQDVPVVSGVTHMAQAASRGRDPLDSPFTYSNVVFEPVAGRDLLHLGFDVSAHLELDRPLADPLVTEVVVQTLRTGTSPLGSRLKAVAVAARLSGAAVESALIAALREDPSPAVRLQALESLSRSAGGPAVRNAVFQALRSESSVQVRLRAIDYLAASGVDRNSLLLAVAAGPDTMREALVVRASQDLQPK